MPPSQIFLSHIHEEKEMALVIKQAIEDEFSGFVDVFVSSDGQSIPAGSNFLRRIEEGLIGCVGAIYLISPESISRNWINFELGAVWIRSALATRKDLPDIPTLPFCHSGISPATLPPPIGNLNAVRANEPASLSFAFAAIQRAVGGRGNIKTDFVVLASKISALENKYTSSNNIIKLFDLINFEETERTGLRGFLVAHLATFPATEWVEIGSHVVQIFHDLEFKKLCNGPLKDTVNISTGGIIMGFDKYKRAMNGTSYSIQIKASALATTLGIPVAKP